MPCDSLLYTVNSTLTTVTGSGTIPFGTVIRRIGCNANLTGDGITLCGAGWYKIDVSITLSPSAIGAVTVAVLKDGVVVPGATAASNVDTAGDSVNLAIVGVTRLFSYDETGNLTLVLSGGSSIINNVAVRIEKA